MLRIVSRTFFQGLIIVVPLALTFYLLFWLGALAEAVFGSPLKYMGGEAYFPGLGAIAGVVLIFVVGALMKVWLSRLLIEWLEAQIRRVPFIKDLYGSIRDLMGFFKTDEKEAQKVVMVEMSGENGPRRILGLMTREDFEGMPKGVAEKDELAVYFPMSYQIGGFTFMVPKAAIEAVEMSVEDGLRFALTGGMTTQKPEVVPDSKAKEKSKKRKKES